MQDVLLGLTAVVCATRRSIVLEGVKLGRFVPPQAADIVRVVGIGRNQYIDLMNQCKVTAP